MSFSIRLHSIKCLEESNEWSASDEVYVLITVADLTPPPPPPGGLPAVTPVPGRPVTTFRYGVWTNFDEGDVVVADNERPFWGPFDEPWEPQNIFNRDNVCIVVTVMEEDNEHMDSYRSVVQLAAAASLGQSFALARPARMTRLLADINSAIRLIDLPTREDNHVGTRELLLDPTDIEIPPGMTKDKTLTIGNEEQGRWELVFRITHHERCVFPGARLAAVSPSWNRMNLFAVGHDERLYVNHFDNRWHGWSPLPGPEFERDSYLAVVSRDANHVEAWGVGKDGMVRGIWYRDGAWKNWYDLPGAVFKPGAPLAAVSRYKDFMEVWGVDVDGIVRHKWFADGWKPENGWGKLGDDQRFFSGAHIAAVSRSPFDMQIWVVGDDKPIRSNRWAPDAWRGWESLGDVWFTPATQLAAVVRKMPPQSHLPPLGGINSVQPELPHVHVLAIDPSENIRDFWYEGETQRGWYQVGIETFDQGTPIAAASRQPHTIDAWSIRQGNPNADHNGFFYTRTEASGWVRWGRLEVQVPAHPQHIAALSRFDGNLEVWTIVSGEVRGNTLVDDAWRDWYSLRWTLTG